uniref:Protein kinase domain-containing protein n=1 Tax=Macrostomum lignano TaxID=282301 RepID=A0A1I8JQ16_9PLAT
ISNALQPVCITECLKKPERRPVSVRSISVPLLPEAAASEAATEVSVKAAMEEGSRGWKPQERSRSRSGSQLAAPATAEQPEQQQGGQHHREATGSSSDAGIIGAAVSTLRGLGGKCTDVFCAGLWLGDSGPRPLRNTANSNLAAAGQAEPLRNANARRLLGAGTPQPSHSRTGERAVPGEAESRAVAGEAESRAVPGAKLRGRAVPVKLRARAVQQLKHEAAAVPGVKLRAEQCQVAAEGTSGGAAEPRCGQPTDRQQGGGGAALTGSDEASLAGSNTVWMAVFTSLSPRTPRGVRLAAVRPAAGARPLPMRGERAAQPAPLQAGDVRLGLRSGRRKGAELLRMVSESGEAGGAWSCGWRPRTRSWRELRAAYPEKIGSAWTRPSKNFRNCSQSAWSNAGCPPIPDRSSKQWSSRSSSKGNRQQEQQAARQQLGSHCKTRLRARRPARRVRYRTEPPDDVAGRADGGVGGDSAGGGSGDCRPGSHSRTATRVSQAAAAGAAAAEAARLRMQPRWQTATAVTAAALALMHRLGCCDAQNFPALTKTHDKLPSRGPAAVGCSALASVGNRCRLSSLGGPHAGPHKRLAAAARSRWQAWRCWSVELQFGSR